MTTPPNPRGRSGTLRGLSAAQVQDILLRLTTELQTLVGPEGSYTSHQAAAILRGPLALQSPQVEAILFALARLPGVERIAAQVYRLPRDTQWAVNIRAWRINVGRLDYVAANDLADILASHHHNGTLPPSLERVAARLRKAVEWSQPQPTEES